MSRGRVRPTREETRARLFAAAAEVFEEHGVGAATVEQICTAAGFTRGAFYSNFDTKDELVVAMLEDHVERSIRHNLALVERYPDTQRFVEAMEEESNRDNDPLHVSQVLHMELILHVARKPEHRRALAERLHVMRTLIGEIVVRTLKAAGVTREIDPQEAGALLLAIEDGLRLHRMIDPSSTPPDAFLLAVRALQELVLDASAE